MKKLILFSFILSLFLVSFVSASAIEINYTTTYDTSLYSGIQIEQLKYEPYPVNPGEYFDIYIKAQAIGDTIKDVTFELTPEFPFSLDSNEKPIREYGNISSVIVLKYKVRVSKDAAEGVNQLKLKYRIKKNENYWITNPFDIQVANSQTDFDLVIQDSTSSETSIAIANIGKNTANSLIVKIPEQQDFRVTGTNGQMVGNLDSGDYTVVSFSLVPTNIVGKSERNLTVQLDYTDLIGERRSIIKNIQVNQQTFAGLNMTGQSYGNFAGGRSSAKKTNSFWSNWWIILILMILIFIIYKKYPKQTKNLFNRIKNRFRKKAFSEHSDKIPDWIQKEKEKKK